MVKKFNTIVFLAVGLLNLFPIIGVISADHLTRLYGISLESPDLLILMRHRAVLFGLLGGLLLLAAFRSSLQVLAGVAGLVSMSSFVIVAYLSDEVGPELSRVVIADIVGSLAIAVVLVTVVRGARSSA